MNMQVNENVVIVKNKAFLAKAEACRKPLLHQGITAKSIVEVIADEQAIHGWKVRDVAPISELDRFVLGQGDSVILDFGEHVVGFPSLALVPVGSPPDAPLYLKFTFGEMPVEVAEPFANYDGWLSKSWLQEEHYHIDVLPRDLTLTRRYSFRYLKIEVIDSSPKYKVALQRVKMKTVSSADRAMLQVAPDTSDFFQALDRVSVKTLEDCMQDVFEDGPKRDRRLWLGDLYLQAQTNYETFDNRDLVKRCLYLFAGLADADGRVAANLFIEPEPIPDDTYLVDYALYFATTLHDYYEATRDLETLTELWPVALNQIRFAQQLLDANYLAVEQPYWWAFVDWNEALTKQASVQGLLIFTLKQAISLAEILDSDEKSWLSGLLEKVTFAAKKYLWDPSQKLFVSGPEKQIAWHSQIWMVMAGILPDGEARDLLRRTAEYSPEIGLTTPFAHHFLVAAWLKVGDKEAAKQVLVGYWGDMLHQGADTFWELFKPDDLSFSPYGSHLINSYCHAWSCTPAYFIRKYHL
ncbi:alpha-L-rhamnosidase-related protein [Listeria newyorkensis]|uniref:Sugar hydrolase n=1 Tax=Listeria newyorkensis TaxID=1497681 RepID=A0A841Z0S6_9LIST|nr:sugar hydrolase [Listeria newyorkensis]MBC1459215.1 sugar hydrolase [Listeria newyorkensis]